MEHVRAFSIDPNLLAKIQAHLSKSHKPLETSELYSMAIQEKILDPSLRNSKYRLFTDDALFEMMEQAVDQLNNHNDDKPNATQQESGSNSDDPPKNKPDCGLMYKFMLVKNDITEIRYGPGDFFDRHSDNRSLTSNVVEEFTMVLCVTPNNNNDPPSTGGDTLIYPFHQTEPTRFDTKTPGRGVIFRKDIDHAGERLVAGHKHILTANLWAVRQSVSQQVLLVTFPPPQPETAAGGGDENKDETKKESKTAMIRRAADPEKSFALPFDLLKGTMLETFAGMTANAQDDDDDTNKSPPLVVEYCCDRFSFKEFSTVAKVLRSSYVDADEIQQHQKCLDYFGPFKLNDMFVSLALEKKPEENEQPSPPKQAKLKSGDEGQDASDATGSTDETPLDLIVCENESRAKVVCEVARSLGEPYVPFKLLFAEGVIQTREKRGRPQDIIPMTPLALFVGGHNNIFSLARADPETKGVTLGKMHQANPIFARLTDYGRSCINQKMESKTDGEHISLLNMFGEDEEEGWDDGDALFDVCEALCCGAGFGLKLAMQEPLDLAKLFHLLFVHRSEFHCDFTVLPGKTSVSHVSAAPSPLFHYDANGVSCFSKEEADKASRFIASFDLEERVKAVLQEKKFELPQEQKEFEEEYCDGSIYGKFNILWVCGAIRLEERKDGEKHNLSAVNFDAWPLENNKIDPSKEPFGQDSDDEWLD